MSSKSEDTRIYERLWFWIIIAIIGIPIMYLIVYYIYSIEYINQKNTSISAGDLLGFIGSFLAFTGTIYLGITANQLNKRANRISYKLLDVEEENNKPCIFFKHLYNEDILSDVDSVTLTFNNMDADIDESNKLIDSMDDVYACKVINPNPMPIINLEVVGFKMIYILMGKRLSVLHMK